MELSTETQRILSQMNIPEKEQEDLAGISKMRNIRVGELFISEGQIPKSFGINVSGLFRYFYVNENGDEFTKGLIIPGSVLTAYSAMLHQQSSLFSIQALEESIILEINYMKWLELQKHNPFWDKFLISLLQKGYFVKEKRERELLLLDAETRYKIFKEEFPGMEEKIRLQIIASYLGIRPESLSRIRKKLSG